MSARTDLDVDAFIDYYDVAIESHRSRRRVTAVTNWQHTRVGSDVLGTLQAISSSALNARHEAREQMSNDAMLHRRVAPRAILGRVPPRSGQYPRECAEDLSTPRKIFEICVYDCPPFRAV